MTSSRRISLISLGCPKNLVDSEGMVSGFLTGGLEVVVDPADADVVVVNTCGFLGSAREESLATLRKVTRLKEDGGVRAVFVTGCMVGHYARDILEAVPEVDRLIDFADYGRLNEIVDEFLPPSAAASPFVQPGGYVQARLTPAHFAYLKISEGCNHTCSFCVIPTIRGKMRSSPLEDLVSRARRLASLGTRELNVVAQDSTLYGVDLYGRKRIAELLEALSGIEELRWIRLLYAYPTEVDDDLMDVLADPTNRVLPYLDVPIQHSSDRMLRLMNRKSSERRVEEMMIKLRERVPGIAIRTTVIVGFPGETDEDFDHLLDFVERHEIDRLGAFPYSPEKGSAAIDLADPVSEAVKTARIDELMTRQQAIARRRNLSLEGRTIEVLIEDPGPEDGEAVGRSRADAPEIDGKVWVSGGRPPAGRIVQARVVRSEAYDLWAELVEED